MRDICQMYDRSETIDSVKWDFCRMMKINEQVLVESLNIMAQLHKSVAI